MTDYPLISVVLTTYNRIDRLRKAVASVLEQTYPNYELLVVDDASSDETSTFMTRTCQDYKQVRYIKLEKNFGCDTRGKNVGTIESKGEFIAYLDDDNEYNADHLMILYQEMKRHPDIDVVYGDRMVVSELDDMEPTLGVHSDFNQALLFERNYIDTMDVLIRRNALFEVGGWDERYKKYVDWNLWVRLCKAGFEFWHVAKVVGTYHLHADMKSTRVKDTKTVGEKPFGLVNPEPLFRPQWDPFSLEIRLPYLGKEFKPKVAVFTLCKDRLYYTKIMYESFQKSGYPFTWFALDNGSTDGTVEWLKSLKPEGTVEDIKLLLNKENHGISIASNECLDAIGDDYDYIIKIDNDNEILSDNWLKELLKIFSAHNRMCLSPYVEGLVDNPGGTPRLAYKTMQGHLLGITPHIGGIFTMTHKSAYKGFRWDEDDPKHAMQDMVFTQAMQKKDFICAYVEDLKCSHQESTEGQKERFPDYFKLRVKERMGTYAKSS